MRARARRRSRTLMSKLDRLRRIDMFIDFFGEGPAPIAIPGRAPQKPLRALHAHQRQRPIGPSARRSARRAMPFVSPTEWLVKDQSTPDASERTPRRLRRMPSLESGRHPLPSGR
jgi:hypothetical protein